MNKNSIRKIAITINTNCIECGKCIEVCPMGVLTCENNPPVSKKPVVFDPEVCISCGHCIAVCPRNAINHNQLLLDDFQEISSMQKLDWDQFILFTRQRRSIRKFNTRPVPIELLDKILKESTRYSPTGHNRQMTEVMIFEGEYLKSIRDEINNTIIRFSNYLSYIRIFSKKIESVWRSMRSFRNMIESGMDPSTRNAPVAILFTADKRIKESEVDATILSYHTLLSAEILGLRSCYFGALINALPYSRKLRKLIKLSSHQKLVCGLLLGYTNIHYNRLVSRKNINLKVMKEL
ncbi:MAG: nitroreductase family protein [Spirochaetales bacterium]|nr:nitroreductase family protein [Spirochaetales bacterium]